MSTLSNYNIHAMFIVVCSHLSRMNVMLLLNFIYMSTLLTGRMN